MKLFAICPSCEKETSFRANVHERVELKKLKGNPMELNCKHCVSSSSCDLDMVYAKSSKWMDVLGVVFALGLIAFLMWGFKFSNGRLAIFTTLPIVIYSVFKYQEVTRVNLFNTYKLNR